MFGPKPPFELGPYRVEKRIGAGGFATVFQALVRGEMGFERKVALKVLHEHIVTDEPTVIAMLADEARLLAAMQHGNIVSVQWFGKLDLPDGSPVYVLVMEYVDGLPLKDIVEDHAERGLQLPLSVALEVLCGVARGLEYAHDLAAADGSPLNLVHRDLKPGNVMLSAQGETKLLDFGIAKAEGRIAEKTATNMLRGSINYLSPEQVYGKPLDFRSDHFPFGALIWEVATSQRLIQEPTVHTAMRAIGLFDVDKYLLENGAQCPELLHPILRRCLAKDPDLRFESTGALFRALDSARRAAGPEPDARGYLKEEVRRAFVIRNEETADLSVLESEVDSQAETAEPVPAPSGLRTGDESFFKNSKEVGADDATLMAPDSTPIAARRSVPGAKAPEPIGPDAEATRAQTRLVDPGPNTQEAQRAVAGRPWLLPAGIVVAGLIGAALLLRPGPAPEPTPVAVATPAATPVAVVATSTPVAVAVATPTPRPAAKPTPAVAPKPTPKPRATPEPVATATGTLFLRASHDFEASVGPDRFKKLQLARGVQLPVGRHTVVVECVKCPDGVETRKEVSVTIAADTPSKNKVVFGAAP